MAMPNAQVKPDRARPSREAGLQPTSMDHGPGADAVATGISATPGCIGGGEGGGQAAAGPGDQSGSRQAAAPHSAVHLGGPLVGLAPRKVCQPGAIEVSGLSDLTAALHRLADVLQQGLLGAHGESFAKLHPDRTVEEDTTLEDEATMAARLRIPVRTLGAYRRQGRFPGCWLRNGRRILWRVEPTLAAWGKGIP